MKTFTKYLLFQIPEWLVLASLIWLLSDRTTIPAWALALFFLVWVAKDIAIYPWVRRAYSNDAKTGTEELIGASAVAQESLDREGYVKVRGELWKARNARPAEVIEPGTVVKICGANGLTLIVKPENQRDEKRGQNRRSGGADNSKDRSSSTQARA